MALNVIYLFSLKHSEYVNKQGAVSDPNKPQPFNKGMCLEREKCRTHDDCKAFKPYEYCRKKKRENDGYCYKNGCLFDDDCDDGDFCDFKYNVGICSGGSIKQGINNSFTSRFRVFLR